MEETKTNKGSGLKYLLFIGIPVLIILGILGAYYHFTNPMQVLTKTINTAYENVDKMIKENNQKINLAENPFAINGNIKFNTDASLDGYEELQNYNYDFSLGLDYKQKLINLEMGINEENTDILHASIYQIDNKLYLKSEKIMDQLLDMTTEEPSIFEDTFENTLDIDEFAFTINSSDIKLILRKIKDILIESLDKNYIKREKTDITIDGSAIKATKITYLLNEENQRRTINFITDKMVNDNELLEALARISNMEEDEVIEDILNSKEEYTYESDITIFLYTEGFEQNVIRASLAEDSIDEITYINYNNKKTLNIENELILTLNEISENKIDIDYELKENNITGNIKINSTTSNNTKTNETVQVSVKSKDINVDVTLELEINTNATLEMPNITNAKKMEELSTEELLDIFTNLEDTLKGTIFYKLIEDSIM